VADLATGDDLSVCFTDQPKVGLVRLAGAIEALVPVDSSEVGGYRLVRELEHNLLQFGCRRDCYFEIALLDQSTIYRWVQRFLLLIGDVARKYHQPVGPDWRVDDT